MSHSTAGVSNRTDCVSQPTNARGNRVTVHHERNVSPDVLRRCDRELFFVDDERTLLLVTVTKEYHCQALRFGEKLWRSAHVSTHWLIVNEKHRVIMTILSPQGPDGAPWRRHSALYPVISVIKGLRRASQKTSPKYIQQNSHKREPRHETQHILNEASHFCSRFGWSLSWEEEELSWRKNLRESHHNVHPISKQTNQRRIQFQPNAQGIWIFPPQTNQSISPCV